MVGGCKDEELSALSLVPRLLPPPVFVVSFPDPNNPSANRFQYLARDTGSDPRWGCLGLETRIQYLIAYSMQIWRGEAWEIWSHAVMSGKQKVDTHGVVPGEEFRSPFLYCRSEDWRPEH